ncbi:MAG: ribonuclease Z [Bacteroidota bacterium]
MSTEVIPLGTASAIPTRDRNLSATALRREGEMLLFDCGEGTQFQLLRAGLKRSRLDALFLTHFHGDHLYGLFGLLTTMALLGREDALTIVAPEGLPDILDVIPGLQAHQLPYPLRHVGLAPGFSHAVVFDAPAYYVEARPLEHRVFAAGYRFQEKVRPGKVDGEKAQALGFAENWHFEAVKNGKPVTINGRTVLPEDVVGPDRPGVSFAYVLDTMPCTAGRRLAEGVDLLIHEATFTEDEAQRAEEVGHSTARQAATIAKQAGAQHLLLTHFSARYADPQPLVDEARTVFPNTAAAEELRTYVLTPPA